MISGRLIDLSCDLGEASTPAEDEIEARIWPLITSANVACGGHTGDAASMERAVERAQNHSVLLGAHPSYPDRENFGRKRLAISPDALRESILEQLRALADVASAYGVTVSHVKPHGALYNDAFTSDDLADSVAAAILSFDPSCALVGPAHSALHRAASERGLAIVAEAFADRRYRSDGSLVPRTEPRSLLVDCDEAARQVLSLAEVRLAEADDGALIEIPFSTICVHGDMPGVVERITAIREKLTRASFAFSHLARSSS